MGNYRLKNGTLIFSILFISIISLSFFFFFSPNNQEKRDILPYFLKLFDLSIKKPLKNISLNIKSSESEVITGNGMNLDTTLYLNLSDQILNCNTSSDFFINTNGWNISKTNLLFTNLTAQFVNDIETSTPYSNYRELNYLRAMSFNVSKISYLQKINISIRINSLSEDYNDLRLYVYNATGSGIPDSDIYYEEIDLNNYANIGFDGWLELPLSTNVLLDPNNTNSGRYFIVLRQTTGGSPSVDIDWYYLEDDINGDSSDEGAVYHRIITWQSQPIDYTLSLTLETKVLPSEIQLSVNSSPVTDLQIENGTWDSSQLFIGPSVFFNIEGNASASFNINWKCQFINRSFSYTQFMANASRTIVNWTTLIFTNFHANSYATGINITIPMNWNISGVINDTNSHLLWANYTENNKKIIKIWEVFNSSWKVICEDINYVHEIYLEKKVGLSFIPISGAVNGTDIIRINASIKDRLGNDISNGDGNLTIFDPFNNTIYIDHNSTLNGLISFQPWQINLTATSNGTYTIQVVWHNQTGVGINITTIDIKSIPTNLILINNTPEANTGDPIIATIYFNDTYWGYGIPNASFYLINTNSSEYFPYFSKSTLTPIGNYSLIIDTSTLTTGTYEFTIFANRSLYNPATVNITFNITGGPSFAWIIEGADPVGPRFGGQTFDNGSFVYDNYNTTPVGNDPYWDDTSRKITINYTDLSGNPITIQDVNLVDILWDNNPTIIIPILIGPGLYNVTLDTTGLSPGLHFLTIIMQTSYYYRAYLNISVNVKPVPTNIDPGAFEVITQYQGEKLQFWVVFLDLFHSNQRIGSPPATINYSLSDKNGTMTYIGSPSDSFYGEVELGDLDIDTYIMTIFASANLKYETATQNITVNITSKNQVSLDIIDLPIGIRVGEILIIKARLINNTIGNPIESGQIELLIDFWDINNVTIPGAKIFKIVTTNTNGTIEECVEIPQTAKYANISLYYRGTIDTNWTKNNTILIINPKKAVNLLLFSPFSSIWVGDLLIIGARLTCDDEAPVSDGSIEFEIILVGDTFLRFTQTGTTDTYGNIFMSFAIPQDTSGVHLIIIKAKYPGAKSFSSTTSNIFPVNLLSISRFFMEYLWLILSIIGAVSSLGAYKTRKYWINRGWNKKIDHLFIMTEQGIPLINWKMGGAPLDSVLVTGALTGVSSIIREMTKSVKKLTSIDHEDKKILFHYGKFVVGVLLTEKDQPIMHQKLKKFVKNFESKYSFYLSTFDGELNYFQDADDLLVDIFPSAAPESIQEKMKLIPDIIKKKKKIRELNIQAGELLLENKIAMAANIYEEAAKIAIDIYDIKEFDKFIINIGNLRKRLSKFSLESTKIIDSYLKSKVEQTIPANIIKIQKAVKVADFLTAIKLTTKNAKLYLELDKPELVLELLKKINKYSNEHQIKMKKIKERRKFENIKKKIKKLNGKAEKNIRLKRFSKVASDYNDAALLALQINDKEGFQNFIAKFNKYQEILEEADRKKEKAKQLELMKKALAKCLAEIESAKLARQYGSCIELYWKAANISKKLGDVVKFREYNKIANEFQKKLENSNKN